VCFLNLRMLGVLFDDAASMNRRLVSSEPSTPLNTTLLPSLSVSPSFCARQTRLARPGWAIKSKHGAPTSFTKRLPRLLQSAKVTPYAGPYCQARAVIDLAVFHLLLKQYVEVTRKKEAICLMTFAMAVLSQALPRSRSRCGQSPACWLLDMRTFPNLANISPAL
jgi:hypothetical protein